LRAPRAAAITRALHDEIDVATVAAAELPALGQRDQRAVTSAHDGGNTVGVIAVGIGNEDLRLRNLVKSLGCGCKQRESEGD
jgi:hypothetical protein